MSLPAPESTKFPFSPLPGSVDAYLAEQGMLSVSEQRINDVLTQSGIRAENIYLPPRLSRILPTRLIHVVSQLRFEAYRAIMIMRICNSWYRRRYEYLYPGDDSQFLQRHIQSVQLLLGWDKDNKPVKDQLIALATKYFKFHLPSDVLPAFNAWKQGDFLTETRKLIRLSKSVPYSPLYEVAVDELATAITQNVEGGEAIARTRKAFATGPHSY
ncbi:hypothetical protein BO83DRAFT_410971 [Aspergillus eucalypticola CBS 122712]|uniref:Uncharacterized protein n=1 Tax=Aspergillus eucalypticola (strain CBS 122712 / IBT 29274) TaxID=1448314 RepID=A0A317UUM4_ASPEC|nr:uncharacterized protein BO83DRAFT_410971 [Aspergillus eucalypticola CBS 122712]PWY65096.1 hypothetical protein BO83DRAFT_410971 [Aspergillus eucalypticola CBS 122712]